MRKQIQIISHDSSLFSQFLLKTSSHPFKNDLETGEGRYSLFTCSLLLDSVTEMSLPSQHIWSYTADPDCCCQWSPHVGFRAKFTGDKSPCREGKGALWDEESYLKQWQRGHLSCCWGHAYNLPPALICSVSDNVLCDGSFLCWQTIYGTWFLFVFLTFYSTTVLTHTLFAVWFLSSSFSPCSLALWIYIAWPIRWPNHYDRCTCLSVMTLLVVINCVLKSSQEKKWLEKSA